MKKACKSLLTLALCVLFACALVPFAQFFTPVAGSAAAGAETASEEGTVTEDTSVQTLTFDENGGVLADTYQYAEFYGRTYYGDGGVVMNAAASGFKVTFTGTGLNVVFKAPYCNGQTIDSSTVVPDAGYTAVKVMVDGEPSYLGTLVQLTGGAEAKSYALVSGLAYGEHTVEVRKASEAQHAHATVLSATVVAADGALASFSAVDKAGEVVRRIEVYGDSLTSGYNTLGSPYANTEVSNTLAEPYYKSSQNFNYRSSAVDTYAYYAAGAFGAQINVHAFEGMTMTSSGGTMGMSAPSDEVAATNQNHDYYKFCDIGYHFKTDDTWTFGEWDFDRYTPDLVIINLGSNDLMRTNADLGEAGTLPAAFTDCYVRLLEKLNTEYNGTNTGAGATKFLLVYNMIIYGEDDQYGMGTTMPSAIEAVVDAFEAKYPAAAALIGTLDASKLYGEETEAPWVRRMGSTGRSLHPYYTEHMEIAEQIVIPAIGEFMDWTTVQDTPYTADALNNDYTLFDATVREANYGQWGGNWGGQIWVGNSGRVTSSAEQVENADGIRVPQTAMKFSVDRSTLTGSSESLATFSLGLDDATQRYQFFDEASFGGIALWVSVPDCSGTENAVFNGVLPFNTYVAVNGTSYQVRDDSSYPITWIDTGTGAVTSGLPGWHATFKSLSVFKNGFEGWIIIPKGALVNNGNPLTAMPAESRQMSLQIFYSSLLPTTFTFSVGEVAVYSDADTFVKMHTPVTVAVSDPGEAVQPVYDTSYTAYNYRTIRDTAGLGWDNPMDFGTRGTTYIATPNDNVIDDTELATVYPGYTFPSTHTRNVYYFPNATGTRNWLTFDLDMSSEYSDAFTLPSLTGDVLEGIALWLDIPALGQNIPLTVQVIENGVTYELSDQGLSVILIDKDGIRSTMTPKWREFSLTSAGFTGWLVLPKGAFANGSGDTLTTLNSFSQSTQITFLLNKNGFGTSMPDFTQDTKLFGIGAIEVVTDIDEFISENSAETVSVTFDDGTSVSESEVAVGQTLAGVVPADPEKSEPGHTYRFDGWQLGGAGETYTREEVAAMTAESGKTLAFTAVFTEYTTVTFNNEDGSQYHRATVDVGETLAGTMPSADPTKQPTDEYSYTFAGWQQEANGEVLTSAQVAAMTAESGQNLTFTAVFDEQSIAETITVTFYNEDGTQYRQATAVVGEALGSGIVPADPVKAQDEDWAYTFAGWRLGETEEVYTREEIADMKAVEGQNLAFTAVFTASERIYTVTVTFYGEDGTSVIAAEQVSTGSALGSGIVPADPVKAGNEAVVYTFAGWKFGEEEALYSGAQVAELILHGDGARAFTAVFNESPRTYTITFYVDGTPYTVQAAYGTIPAWPGEGDPVKAEDENYTYTFDGWDTPLTEVTGSTVYTAVFTATPKEGAELPGEGEQGGIVYEEPQGNTNAGLIAGVTVAGVVAAGGAVAAVVIVIRKRRLK